MKQVLCMAIKDLRLLSRDKMGAFFIIGFPILMGLFFGLMMGGAGGSGGTGKMEVAIVDQDASDISKKFVETLTANKSLKIEAVEFETARESVRKGNRVAMLVLPKGFGETAGVFWDTPPKIQLGVDPSRNAEAGMLQGFVMEGIGQLVAYRFQHPNQMRGAISRQRELIATKSEIEPANKLLLGALFGSVEGLFDNMDALQSESVGAVGPANSAAFNFADIQALDISRELDPNSVGGQLQRIRSQWDISFPQAMMWGVMGCVAGFSISIARERTHGTMVRLQVAPVSRFEILAGKASDNLRFALKVWVDLARTCLVSGLPLVQRTPRWLARDIQLFARGGLTILNNIARANFNVWDQTIEVSKKQKLALLLRAILSPRSIHVPELSSPRKFDSV